MTGFFGLLLSHVTDAPILIFLAGLRRTIVSVSNNDVSKAGASHSIVCHAISRGDTDTECHVPDGVSLRRLGAHEPVDAGEVFVDVRFDQHNE